MSKLQSVLLKLLLKTAYEGLDSIAQAAAPHPFTGSPSTGAMGNAPNSISVTSTSSCQVLPLICKAANHAQSRINKKPHCPRTEGGCARRGVTTDLEGGRGWDGDEYKVQISAQESGLPALPPIFSLALNHRLPTEDRQPFPFPRESRKCLSSDFESGLWWKYSSWPNGRKCPCPKHRNPSIRFTQPCWRHLLPLRAASPFILPRGCETKRHQAMKIFKEIHPFLQWFTARDKKAHIFQTTTQTAGDSCISAKGRCACLMYPQQGREGFHSCCHQSTRVESGQDLPSGHQHMLYLSIRKG